MPGQNAGASSWGRGNTKSHYGASSWGRGGGGGGGQVSASVALARAMQAYAKNPTIANLVAMTKAQSALAQKTGARVQKASAPAPKTVSIGSSSAPARSVTAVLAARDYARAASSQARFASLQRMAAANAALTETSTSKKPQKTAVQSAGSSRMGFQTTTYSQKAPVRSAG